MSRVKKTAKRKARKAVLGKRIEVPKMDLTPLRKHAAFLRQAWRNEQARLDMAYEREASNAIINAHDKNIDAIEKEMVRIEAIAFGFPL